MAFWSAERDRHLLLYLLKRISRGLPLETFTIVDETFQHKQRVYFWQLKYVGGKFKNLVQNIDLIADVFIISLIKYNNVISKKYLFLIYLHLSLTNQVYIRL